MIEKFTMNRAREIIDMHRKVLGHTLNSRIGPWFLEKLYQAAGTSIDNGFCYISTEEGSVTGFISFCLDQEDLERNILGRLSLRDRARIGIFFLSHPERIPDFFRQRNFAKFLKRSFKRPYASILTLGVSPEIQHQGIGRQLVGKAKEVAKSQGVKDLFVDTEETNTGAISFYKKNNFEQAASAYGNIVLRCAL